MWEVEPRGVFRFAKSFHFREGMKELTEVRNHWESQQANFSLGGQRYSMRREPSWGSGYRLDAGSDSLATAKKLSLFNRRFSIDVAGERFDLAPEGFFVRTFELRQAERIVGTIEPRQAFSRRALVHLPEELDPAVRVFLTWLVFTSWQRNRMAPDFG